MVEVELGERKRKHDIVAIADKCRCRWHILQLINYPCGITTVKGTCLFHNKNVRRGVDWGREMEDEERRESQKKRSPKLTRV